MKIRIGFVSNSSSSSFICDVCGEDVSGMDMCLSDAEMHQCKNGHTICDSHLDKNPNSPNSDEEIKKAVKNSNWYKKDFEKKFNKKIEEATNEDLDKYIDGNNKHDILSEMRYEMSAELCPCCKFSEVASDDIIKYFFKKHNTNHKKISEEMQVKFKNYDEFKKWLKN